MNDHLSSALQIKNLLNCPEITMKKHSALIIEDNEMLATFFCNAFQDAGYEVESASDGALAFSYLEHNVPAIIMLDLQLPDIAGEGILTFVRSQPRFEKTRVFATSIEGMRVSYLQDSVDMVLTKPVSYKQLVKLAKRMIPKSCHAEPSPK